MAKIKKAQFGIIAKKQMNKQRTDDKLKELMKNYDSAVAAKKVKQEKEMAAKKSVPKKAYGGMMMKKGGKMKKSK